MHLSIHALVLFLGAAGQAADWPQFRGPGGQGTSAQMGLPLEWSAQKNIVWKTKLPGAGASSPVTTGGRVFVTCYSGYGLDSKEPGKMEGPAPARRVRGTARPAKSCGRKTSSRC